MVIDAGTSAQQLMHVRAAWDDPRRATTRSRAAERLGWRPARATARVRGLRASRARLRARGRSLVDGMVRARLVRRAIPSPSSSPGSVFWTHSLVPLPRAPRHVHDRDERSVTVAVAGGALPVVFIIGMVFMVSGIAFKVSAAPFHMWTPDVYEGSPTTVTALFAIAPKVAAMALMMRLTYGAFGPIADEWSQVLIALSIASMVVGALGAIMQTDIKRMMAYSSIAHMGYALAGLAAGSEAGALGVMIYMTGYVFMGGGTFAIILLMRREGKEATKIADLKGLSQTHPLPAIGLLIMMFSMAGIPPLAGFFGKWYVFLAAVQAGLIPLAVIGVSMSVVGAFYYLRIIRLMYFEDADNPLDVTSRPINRFVLMVSIGVVLLFFAGLGSLIDTAGSASTVFTVMR